jgi:hypothetical protein
MLMKNKKIIFALSAIVAVAAILFVSEKMAAIRPPEHRLKFFPYLEARQITAIAVNDGGSVVRLEKRGGEWMVGAGGAGADSASDAFSPADDGLVQIALERIASLKKGELVSGNPGNQAAFEVGDGNKSFVEVYAGGDAPAGVLRIGKNGPDWNSNYARISGGDTVYLISGLLRQALFFDVERWRKKEETGQEDSIDTVDVDVE